MFGTVARFTVKEGAEDRLIELMNSYEEASIPGHVASTVYKLRDGERQYMMATSFEDEASYRANAESPAQNERFLQMRELLEGDPEWNDGDIVSVQ
jgi:heme-degrading monooxygenase HmoA